MARSGKRVLITGIDGFTGVYLSQELQVHGYDVFGSVQSEGALSQLTGKEQRFRCDLKSLPQLRTMISEVQPEVVVNLAGISFPAHDDRAAIYQVNTIGALNLLQALHDHQLSPRLLLVSSAHVYGNRAESPISESSALDPISDYAVSKLSMEYMSMLWREQFAMTWIRPFNYTGVGQASHFLPPKIVGHFRERKPLIELGNLDVARDWSDVRDVVSVYRQLIECSEAEGQIVNMCSGRSHTLMEVLDTMRELSGHDLEVRVNPEFVRANELKELRGDDSRLRRWLGEKPSRPLRETLSWMLSAE